jgi:hypothetical protein
MHLPTTQVEVDINKFFVLESKFLKGANTLEWIKKDITESILSNFEFSFQFMCANDRMELISTIILSIKTQCKKIMAFLKIKFINYFYKYLM